MEIDVKALRQTTDRVLAEKKRAEEEKSRLKAEKEKTEADKIIATIPEIASNLAILGKDQITVMRLTHEDFSRSIDNHISTVGGLRKIVSPTILIGVAKIVFDDCKESGLKPKLLVKDNHVVMNVYW